MSEETTRHTPNLESAAERRESRHEFELTREDILVALLEDLVISEDDPNYPDDPKTLRSCERIFRTIQGDELTASAMPAWLRKGLRWNWGIYITRKSELGLLSLRISPNPYTSNERAPYRAVQDESDGNHIPLTSGEVTHLISLVASMTPISDTTYELRPPALEGKAEIE
jgi:hypothetical protein